LHSHERHKEGLLIWRGTGGGGGAHRRGNQSCPKTNFAQGRVRGESAARGGQIGRGLIDSPILIKGEEKRISITCGTLDGICNNDWMPQIADCCKKKTSTPRGKQLNKREKGALGHLFVFTVYAQVSIFLPRFSSAGKRIQFL